MVFALIIHSLEDGAQSHAINDNTSLLTMFYTEEGNDIHRHSRELAICDEAHKQCMGILQNKQKGKMELSYVRHCSVM